MGSLMVWRVIRMTGGIPIGLAFALSPSALTTILAGTKSLSSSSFGQIQGDMSGNNGLDAGNPRIIPLAMKFVF